MKFIVSSTLLLKNLQAVGGILNSRNTMPILDDFLFELNEDNLKITASDLETTMITDLKVDMAEGSGSIAIPAKTVLDMLKTFADIPISFNINPSTQAIDISAGEGRYKMAGHNGDEFPKIPEFDETETIVLPSATLQNAISKTIFATSNEEFRPGITGVLFDIYPDEIIFVATDAHKLVKYTKTGETGKEKTSFIVPKKPLNQLKATLGTDEYEVKVEYNKTNVTFSFGNIQLFSRLISGAFPNYNAIIPQDNPNKMIIDRALMITTLRRVGFFANQSTNQVRLSISGQELLISGEDSEYASEAKERLACEYKGQDLVIGFNSRFLLELLSHIESDQINMEFSAPNRAAVVLPIEDESDEKLFMLISPVMLNS
ncbi:DNA polymerase III subunit beta [Bacteroidales bacterium OttesenSCG-928-K22]|nr:DNA polymerase III subunit beta [Bacteroidales bacterium OttesenSCG-928-L14]MDL2240294.1 DNA polymerase III subunit beta [Bacteroidales bacterium OttesenSCG-928-K22]